MPFKKNFCAKKVRPACYGGLYQKNVLGEKLNEDLEVFHCILVMERGRGTVVVSRFVMMKTGFFGAHLQKGV